MLLTERVKAEAAAVRSKGDFFALHFLDLDGFKGINDVLGHSIGDRLLREVGERLRATIRPGDMVARLGGDEFAIVQTGLFDASDAAEFGHKLIEVVAKTVLIDGAEINATASVGIAISPADGLDADELLKSADLAMYRAKADGGRTVRFFSADLHTKAQEMSRLDARLRRAVEQEEFVLHYQPQISVKTGRIVGAEALIRWRREDGTLGQPGEFLPRAEENGLIIPMNEWALHEACRQAKEWQEAGLQIRRMAVNLSPVQFRRQNMCDLITGVLDRSGLDPAILELEITESIVMENTDSLLGDFEKLRDLGVRFAIDDFGTGYSSFKYIKSYPITRLKIDKSFIQNMDRNASDYAIVHAIIGLCKNLELAVLAEGVETEAQMRRLRSEGCDEVQGFHFSRPLPGDVFAELLPRRPEGRANRMMKAVPGQRAVRPGRKLQGPLGRLKAFLRSRPDGEHEMVINRLIIGPLVLIYLAIAYWLETPGVEQEFFLVISVYVGASVAISLDLARRPGVSVLRRYLAMATDLGVLSYGLHVGGGITSLLYPIYLWTIFGNGFRFGMQYLFVATAMSVAGFAFVIRHSDYWLANPQLALGLLAGLVILPLYASTLIRKLSDAKAVAEEASRAKSLFLASVSHELRTPLNAVIATSDLLRESDLNREDQDMASMIGLSARSLLSLIDELLNFSRLEAGRMPVNDAAFDLDGLLAEVRGMLMPQARAKGLSLNLRIDTATPTAIKSDKSHLREVLVNLTGNALKFTEKGSVRIGVEPAVGDEGEALLRFEVSDTGIGIAEASLARIFDSFTQADDSIINRYGGTGLGLAISKQLIELHGGRISVDSEPGKGSTFWFEIPVQPAEGAAANLATMDAVGVVIAADAAGREHLAEKLEARGIAVQSAANRGEMLELLETIDAGGKTRPFVLIDGAHDECAAIAHDLAARETAMPLPAIVASADPRVQASAPDYYIATLPLPLPDAELDRTLNMVAAAQIGTSKPIADAMKASSGRRFTILVADDNATNQKVIGKILERAGHAVRMVNNGEEAVDLLMAVPFDLVLMDINMPVMDGIEATKLYRFASLGRERVPILALTADATSEARAKCLEAGMDGCVTKPIEPAKLLQLVDETVTVAPGDIARVLDETVADLAAHPRFRGDNKPVLDRATLQELEELGGESFVAEVVAAFVSESTRILEDIDVTAAENDVQAFHERTHALRSGAANIGARRFYEACLAVRAIEADDFAATGKKHAAELRAEFDSAVRELDAMQAGWDVPDSVARLAGERSRR